MQTIESEPIAQSPFISALEGYYDRQLLEPTYPNEEQKQALPNTNFPNRKRNRRTRRRRRSDDESGSDVEEEEEEIVTSSGGNRMDSMMQFFQAQMQNHGKELSAANSNSMRL